MAKRQQFTKECKLEAVRLWKSSGRPAAAVARALGLRRNHLYKWQLEVETHGEAAFPSTGGRAHSTDELTRLRRENARLREERDIFKKAATFFAQESPRDIALSRPIGPSISSRGSARSSASVGVATMRGAADPSVRG